MAAIIAFLNALGFDGAVKTLFAIAAGSAVAYTMGRIREGKKQEALNELNKNNLDFQKLKMDLDGKPIDELLAMSNEELLKRRAEHKAPKG